MAEMNNYERFTQNAMDFLSTRPEYEALVRDADLGSNLMFTNDNRMIDIWDGLASDQHTNESFVWTMKTCQNLIINTMVNNINDYTQINNILVDNQNCVNDNPINNMINYTMDEDDDQINNNQMDDDDDTIIDDDTINDDDIIGDDDTIIDPSIDEFSIGDDFDFVELAREIERHIDTDECMCSVCRNCADSNIRPPMLTRQPSSSASAHNFDERSIWSRDIMEPKINEHDLWSHEPSEPRPLIPTLSRQPSEMLYGELNPYAFPWLPSVPDQTPQLSIIQPEPRRLSIDDEPLQTFDM